MLVGEHAASIWSDISEAGHANSYARHLHEHMAERRGIPGVVRWRCYRATDGAAQQFWQAR
jgi:hypothetical protein